MSGGAEVVHAPYGGAETTVRRFWAVPLDPGLGGKSYESWGGRLLPLCPLWPGFAANTIFYTATLWLPIRGPFVLRRHLRRHLRRKHGHCLSCGYDLRGDLVGGCPECGWNREDAKA